jgi:hypothetical protein
MRAIAVELVNKAGSGGAVGGWRAFFVGTWPRVLKKALSSALTCKCLMLFAYLFVR